MLSESKINKMKEKILGKDFFLSIAFIGDKEMQRLNKIYRKKDKTTDILSFPLSKNSGEILLSKKEVARKARQFDTKAEKYLPYLLIHGLLHLKGLTHSSKMDEQEKKFCTIFGIKLPNFLNNESKNNSRNRRRNLPSKSGSGRTSPRKRLAKNNRRR